MGNFRMLKTGGVALFTLLAVSACSVSQEPFTTDEVFQHVFEDKGLIMASQEPISGSIDLAEATARALKYNLAHRIQVMEAALSNENYELAKFDMLPILTVEGGYTARDSENASVSETLRTRTRTIDPTFSDDQKRWTASGTFTWSILDFGVSYLQARQEGNRYIIAQLARDKSMAQMAQRVRTAYWRAASLQTISDEVDALFEQAAQSRQELEGVYEQRLRPPVQVLEEIRALTEILQQLETMRQSVRAAMIDLASLINVPPGTTLRLSEGPDAAAMPRPQVSLDDLELLALLNSSDYTSQIYNVRIDRDEARKSLLRLLPGAELFVGLHYDSNSFLEHKSWTQVGGRLTWNIMRLLAAPQISDQNDARSMLTQARRLAAHMGAITLVHTSWQDYMGALEQFDRAYDINALDQKIQSFSTQAEQARATAGSESLRNRVRALRSNVAQMLAYAAAQEAYGTMLVALGVSMVPEDYQAHSVADLSEHIRAVYRDWAAGDFPALSDVRAARDAEATSALPPADSDGDLIGFMEKLPAPGEHTTDIAHVR